MEKILEVSGLTKIKNKRKLVDNVSFSVDAGEVFGLVGPNGSGKTSTFRMILGLSRITEGEVFVCGHSIKSRFETAMQHIGGMTDNFKFYRNMSGMDNLQHLAGLRCPKGVAQEEIDRIVALMGLQKRITDKVKTYSLGMCQRLGLAQAMLHNPRLLLLDEPTNGLDPQGIKELRKIITDYVLEYSAAVVISSHLLSEVEMLCDRVAIMSNGKIADMRSTENEQRTDTGTVYRFTLSNVQGALALLKGQYPIQSVGEDYIDIVVDKNEANMVMLMLINCNIMIENMQAVEKTLEDVFMEATGGESQIE